MKRRNEVWSVTRWETWRDLAQGEMTTSGTRVPRRSSCGFDELGGTAAGGGTWSKNPPPSSYVKNMTSRGQRGLATRAS
jgi:hypothetical protein